MCATRFEAHNCVKVLFVLLKGKVQWEVAEASLLLRNCTSKVWQVIGFQQKSCHGPLLCKMIPEPIVLIVHMVNKLKLFTSAYCISLAER